MPLDARLITGLELEELFRDKDTGEPLAFGTVEFFQDNNRVVPKLVYTLQNAANPPTPPNYGYVALPNPITLSAVGTVSDNNGNNVPIYYFPFDGTPALSNDTIELYYVVIRNSSGVVQFTREAWPNTTEEDNPANLDANISNELSNPQFIDVSFVNPATPLVITLVGAATTTVNIAPRWDLIIQHTGNGTITIVRTPIAGVLAYPGNPPYTLTVTPGLNIAAITLRQRLNNNPDVFGRAVGGANGYLSGSVLLAPGSNLIMSYQPNGQAAQQILAANNVSGVFAEFNNTVQLTPANNPSTGDVGYVDILLDLPIVGATTLSNVQIVGLNTNVQNVGYDQVTTHRQQDQLFNYYNSLLQYKPIPSWLIGWHFPLNPTQIVGATGNAGPFATGANTSSYVWDQTIIFQSVSNSFAVTKATGGALRITPSALTQLAVIQYLDSATARAMLVDELSVNISAIMGNPPSAGVVGTVSLWATLDANLPNIGANASIVATLDANGKPATFNGNWTEITRNNLGDARFTVTNSPNPVLTNQFNNYGFNSFDINGAPLTLTATYFAIVVGFAAFNGNYMDIESISCCTGSIPTLPGAQSQSEVLLACNRFYEKSFALGTAPATAIGAGTGEFVSFQAKAAGQPSNVVGSYPYRVPKRIQNPTNIIYNPVNANNQVYNSQAAVDCSASTAGSLGQNRILISCTTAGGTAAGENLIFHWTSDARLGF